MQILIMPQAVIEKIPLPIDLADSRSDTLKVANQIRQIHLGRNTNQHMQVIGHEQKQFQIPAIQLVISACRFQQHARELLFAQLVLASSLAANGDEVGRAKTALVMDRMVEMFANWPSRFGSFVHTRRAIEVNRPYLIAQLL
jgi:hypothetical protein